MKVSQLIEKLQEIKDKRGDLPVFVGNEYGHNVELRTTNIYSGDAWLYIDEISDFELEKDTKIVYLGG